MNVLSRVHRILRPIPAFRDLTVGQWPADAPALPNLALGEVALGAYSNDWSNYSDIVLFTTNSIYVLSAGLWSGVAFEQVEGSVAPSNKDNVTGFSLILRDKRTFWLPIGGSRLGRFYDAFEVLRFVNRILEDIRGK